MAAGMPGLSSKLLEAARTRGDLRRGRETRQLDLGYRTSPLAHDARGDDAIAHAGDRAPDAPCRGAAGQPLRLFTLLGGGAWTLLRYEPAGASYKRKSPATEAELFFGTGTLNTSDFTNTTETRRAD